MPKGEWHIKGVEMKIRKIIEHHKIDLEIKDNREVKIAEALASIVAEWNAMKEKEGK